MAEGVRKNSKTTKERRGQLTLFFFGRKRYFSYIYIICQKYNLFILVMSGTNQIGRKGSPREIAGLVRRRMIQKNHGDKNKYTRKEKHKNKSYE